ncbi:hypothetical protein ONA70_11305 [Micromonospora yasonensis]|uniref:alpha-L-arabinofuranosidase C-terminal domain-containing protein n=1 Tax=Micromonospora yasonensis TaxID=1128667 RepID=UPI00222FBDC7|nr:alpha-L-arabinofuranosidase C-terminal domain-containing protein [Micromonospora yasonensis]MCW3840686.1 hypothetical protein [Micromonospora yasonensis]
MVKFHRRPRPGVAALAVGTALSVVLLTVIGPPAPARAGGQASLQVDINSPIRFIHPQLFGSNVGWNAQSDFMKPDTTLFYPHFLTQVREVGYGAQRFPGGTLASFYHWKRAIGPLQDRQPNTFFGNGSQQSQLGPDEFGQLMELTGATGNVILNHSESLQDARDYVAYMTLPAPGRPITDPADPKYWAGLRAKNGHPAPYDIPWWEVGNEVNTQANAGWLGGSLVSYANGACPVDNVKACLYDFGGTTRFTDEPVGDGADSSQAASVSTGEPAQEKYVDYPPVAPSSVTVSVGGQPWTQVASLSDAASTATVYRLDAATGQIVFGDGVHGAIPPAGSSITASYDSGPHPGFVDFYREMKAVNPAIHVCLGSSSDPTAGGAYFQNLGSTYPYDCVATHPYVRPGNSRAQGQISNSLPEADYNSELLAMPDVLADQVRKLRAKIDQAAGPRAAEVDIVLTEFGQLQSSNPTFEPKYHLTLQQSLLLAGLLREWVDLGVPLAEQYLLAGSPFGSTVPNGNVNVNSAIVGPGPDTVVEPAALVEQLFRPLGGQQQVTVQSDAIPALSLRDGTQLPVLETVAAHSGNTITLVVINQSDRTAVPTTITAAGTQLLRGAVTTLNADSALSYNTPDNPTAVSLHRRPLEATSGQVTATFPAHSVSLIELTFQLNPVPVD